MAGIVNKPSARPAHAAAASHPLVPPKLIGSARTAYPASSFDSFDASPARNVRAAISPGRPAPTWRAAICAPGRQQGCQVEPGGGRSTMSASAHRSIPAGADVVDAVTSDSVPPRPTARQPVHQWHADHAEYLATGPALPCLRAASVNSTPFGLTRRARQGIRRRVGSECEKDGKSRRPASGTAEPVIDHTQPVARHRREYSALAPVRCREMSARLRMAGGRCTGQGTNASGNGSHAASVSRR